MTDPKRSAGRSQNWIAYSEKRRMLRMKGDVTQHTLRDSVQSAVDNGERADYMLPIFAVAVLPYKYTNGAADPSMIRLTK